MASNVEDNDAIFGKKGQRFPTPSPGAGGRVFYESLFREKPASPMALVWCIEYGVLPQEEADKMFPTYLKLKQAKKDRPAGGK